MNIQKKTIVSNSQSQTISSTLALESVKMIKIYMKMYNLFHQKASEGCRIIVHPTATGMIRGSHNCGECDQGVAAAIERYSVSADIQEFDGIDCHCKEYGKAIQLMMLPVPGIGRDRRISMENVLRALNSYFCCFTVNIRPTLKGGRTLEEHPTP